MHIGESSVKPLACTEKQKYLETVISTFELVPPVTYVGSWMGDKAVVK